MLFIAILLFSLITSITSPAAANYPLHTPHPFSTPTAVHQFQHLNRIPIHFFLRARRLSTPLNIHVSSIVTLLVILSGDIHLNPGPAVSNTTLGTLNIRSLFHQNRSVAVSDMLTSHNIHILALSDPWQNQTTTTPAQLRDITPPQASSSMVDLDSIILMFYLTTFMVALPFLSKII